MRQNSTVAKTIFLFLWCIAWLLSSAHLQAADLHPSSPSSCLWKVETDQNTLYLLGSIHLLKEENYPLHRNIYQTFDEASHLVFEVNLGELSSPQVQLELASKGIYTNGESLKDTLSPESYARVKSYLNTQGLGMEPFHLMKPWLMATTLTTLELQKLGFSLERGVDSHLFEKAKKEGKKIEGLETVSYQLGLLDNLSPTTQELFLLQTLEELSILEKEMEQIIESWSVGRTAGLEVLLKSMREFPEVYKALITERNKNWMPHIESYLQQQDTYLIVVGTLHLLGEEGLLSLLKALGYEITQL